MRRTMVIAIAVTAMLVGVVAYAQAAGTQVVVTGTAADKVEIRVQDGFETWATGAVVPDAVTTTARTVEVRSNKPFTYQSVVTKDPTAPYTTDYTLTSDFEAGIASLRTPGSAWVPLTDNLTLTMGWPDSGATFRATVDYSVF